MSAGRLPNFSNLLDDLSTTSQVTTNDHTLDGQVVLEENSNFHPDIEEIEQYATNVLEIDLDKEPLLIKIAEEGILAPLPAGWKPVQSDDGQLYYFNFDTGESMWDHPCDEFFRKQVAIAREKMYGKEGPLVGGGEDKKVKRKGGLAKRGSVDALTSSVESLSPIRRFRNYGNVSEDSERDFIRNMKLRSSQEFEEQNKIEPPPVKRPLIASCGSNASTPALAAPTKKDRAEGLLYTDDFDISEDDSDVKPKDKILQKDIEPSPGKPLLKDPSNTSLTKKSSKTVTFHEENPLGNLVSESSMDELSSYHVGKYSGESANNKVNLEPTLSDKSPMSSVSVGKNDIRTAQLTESVERHVKEQMQDVEAALEQAKQEFELDKAKRISDLVDRLALAERKEAQLIKDRTAEVEQRSNSLETELAATRRAYERDRQSQLDEQVSSFKNDLDAQLKSTKENLEKSHHDEIERVKKSFEVKREACEKEVLAHYNADVAALKLKYADLGHSEERRLKRDYSEQVERAKRESAQETNLLAEQKDEMEQNLSKQMQRLEAQHARSVEQLTEQHTSERQRLIAEQRRLHETTQAQLESDLLAEQEAKRAHLKRQQELYLDRVRSEISTENYELETKKSSLEAARKRLEIEQTHFEERAAEFKQKMADLESSFEDTKKAQRKEIEQKLVDLMTDKDTYESAVMRAESRKEALERDIERLNLERKEVTDAVKRVQEELLQTRHDFDLHQMKLETVKIQSGTIGIHQKQASSVSVSHDSDVSDRVKTADELKLDLNGLRTTSTNKTGPLGLSTSLDEQMLAQMGKDAQMDAMQSKINELEQRMSSYGRAASSGISEGGGFLAGKPPLAFHMGEAGNRFMPNPTGPNFQSPYDTVDNEMANRRQQLERYLTSQNDWWTNSNPTPGYPHQVSKDFEDLTAKELIRKRVEVMQPRGGGLRARHDSYQSQRSTGNVLSGQSSVTAHNPWVTPHNIISNSTPVKPVKSYLIRDSSSMPSSPPVAL